MMDQNISGDAELKISASVNFIAPGIALSASCEINGVSYVGFLLSQDVSERYATNLRANQDPSNPPSESALVMRTAYDVPVEVRKSFLEKQETFQSEIVRLSDEIQPHSTESSRMSECTSGIRNVKKSKKRKNNWLKGQLPRRSRKKLIRRVAANHNLDCKTDYACDKALTDTSVSRGTQSVRAGRQRTCKATPCSGVQNQLSKSADVINEKSSEDLETVLWTAKIDNNDSDRTGNRGSMNCRDLKNESMTSRRFLRNSSAFLKAMKQQTLETKHVHQFVPVKSVNDKSKQFKNLTTHRQWTLSLESKQSTSPDKYLCNNSDVMGSIPGRGIFELPCTDPLSGNSSVIADQENQTTDTPTAGTNLKVECNPARVC